MSPRRRKSRRDALVFATALLIDSSIAARASPQCLGDLTFRWTSGEPIRLDVLHPGAEALQNAPFLQSPEILSVDLKPGPFGVRLRIKLGLNSAAVLARETGSHTGQQLLVMLDETVLVAAIVRTPMSSVMDLQGPDLAGVPDKLLAFRLCATRKASLPTPSTDS